MNNFSKIAVRKRPISLKEEKSGQIDQVKIIDSKVVCLIVPKNHANEKSKEKIYVFDHAFDIDASQKEIFDKTVGFLVKGVLQGYNATVFAYGATGAGKTYTMMGSQDKDGIMQLAISQLYKKLKYETDEAKMSYLQIYNENIIDLLRYTGDHLELQSSPQGMNIQGIKEEQTKSVEEILQILELGSQNRLTKSTNANHESSRSHAIVQIKVTREIKDEKGEKLKIFSKLSLIDLAGSERACQTLNRGMRLFEGAQINKSLLSLGNCIKALVRRSKGLDVYVPYRDSKLTRLLKDSLSGNCRTVMIVNISPASNNYEDTHNTLTYANRAKNIKTTLNRNEMSTEYHVKHFQDEISKQMQINLELKNQLYIQVLDKSFEPIRSNVNHLQIDRLYQKVKSYFEDQIRQLKVVQQQDDQLDHLQTSLFRIMYKQSLFGKNSRPHENLQKIIGEKQKSMIKMCKEREKKLRKFQKSKTNEEGLKLEILKHVQENSSINWLLVQFNQFKNRLKNYELLQNEQQLMSHINQKGLHLKTLREQLDIREKILSNQLNLLNKQTEDQIQFQETGRENDDTIKQVSKPEIKVKKEIKEIKEINQKEVPLYKYIFFKKGFNRRNKSNSPKRKKHQKCPSYIVPLKRNTFKRKTTKQLTKMLNYENYRKRFPLHYKRKDLSYERLVKMKRLKK